MIEVGCGSRDIFCANDLNIIPLMTAAAQASLEYVPSSNAIYLEVDPPDTRDAKHEPQVCLSHQWSDREPLDNKEVAHGYRPQERNADNEEEDMEENENPRGLGGDGQERRDAGA